MANDPHAAAAHAAMEQDAADVASRDQTAWDAQVAMTNANVAQTEAMAHALRSRGDLMAAAADAIRTAAAIAALGSMLAVVRAGWRAVR
jgi:hypothetical protein